MSCFEQMVPEMPRVSIRDERAAPRQVRLYTRPGCSLCERVVPVLDRLAAEGLIAWESVNIETDPLLLKQYADRIPVVEVEGAGVLAGRVSEYRLRRLLEGKG